MENCYIKKYKEYIAFLRVNQDDLLDNDNWDSLFSVLQFLKLSDEYTLDDYRSKKSTDNILRLYARKVETKRPAETEFEKIDFGNFVQRWLKAVLAENEDAENTTVKLPERIEPESVVTLDFTPEAIWDAYLLKLTNLRSSGPGKKMKSPNTKNSLKRQSSILHLK